MGCCSIEASCERSLLACWQGAGAREGGVQDFKLKGFGLNSRKHVGKIFMPGNP